MKLNKVGRFCTSILIISIVLGVTIQNPDYPVSKIISNFDLNKPSLDDFEGAIPLIDSFESPYIPQSAASQPTPPPRTGFQLKELVESLIEATPIESRDNDTDGDHLPNSVEIVIGTDWNNSDSDYDRLSDYDEIWTDLDPLEPDSNKDNYPDYYEVTDVISLDIDSDGLSNAWDFDNDGDNVNDAIDLSPLARSDTQESLHFELTTTGNPTYLSFQLRPENPDHLKLIGQTWDWPDDDREGVMQDWVQGTWVEDHMEYPPPSKEDVRVMPFLKLSANTFPDPVSMHDYGIQITEDSAYIPLFPIWEHGTIVALSGKMAYPETTPMSLSIDAQLIWQVIGEADRPTYTLNTIGLSMSASDEGTVVATRDNVTASELFYRIDLGENRVALRSITTGRFLSVEEDGSLVATGSELSEREIFEAERQPEPNSQTYLKAYNNEYVAVKRDGSLVGTSSYIGRDWTAFGLRPSSMAWPENIVLVTYNEAFMLTGLSVEEHYGTEVSVFYSADTNQTIGANVALALRFLRNATTALAEMPALLTAQHNVTVSHLHMTASHPDAAFWALIQELTPTALGALPTGQILPLITAVEDRRINFDLAQLEASSPVLGNTWAVDLTAEPIVTSKSLKTDWYDTSNYEVREIDEIFTEIQNWGLAEQRTVTLLKLMLVWNTGEHMTTHIGEIETEFTPYDFTWWADLSLILTIIDDLSSLFDAPMQGSYAWFTTLKLKNALIGTRLARGAKSTLIFLKAKCGLLVKTFSGLWKSCKALLDYLDIAGYIVGIGIAFYALFDIGQSTQWSHTGTNLALLYFLWQSAFTIAISLIGVVMAGPVGALLVLWWVLFDYIGGWSNVVLEAIWDAMYHFYLMTEVSLEPLPQASVTFEDWDANGPDVGDRIEYQFGILGKITATPQGDYKAVTGSSISPIANVLVPSGSNSGSLRTTRVDYDFYDRSPEGMWSTTEFNTGVWVQPNVGMPNFPFLVWLSVNYTISYMEEEFSLLDFQWHQYRHTYDDTIRTDPFWVYFDVLPGTISDFANWRGITSYDHDHDGLLDREEDSTYDTHPWRWDSDADGLNDKYEVDLGTDPTQYDSDGDGLLDWFELVYGTDPTNRDSDFDGLADYFELTGWVIAFNYSGQEFKMPVQSDPLLLDSDEDHLNDQLEYYGNLNPRSKDTDADDIADINDVELTVAKHLLTHELTINPAFQFNPLSVALDSEGDLYVTDPRHDCIQKFSPNGTHLLNLLQYQIRAPYGVTVGSDGMTYVLDGGSEVTSTPQRLVGTNNPIGGSNFGRVVSINTAGTVMVVGEPNVQDGSGAVHVFEWDGTDWVQQQKLIPSDPLFRPKDYFGWSVALDAAGDTLVVGAYEHSFGFRDTPGYQDLFLEMGAAYVFERIGGFWIQQTKLYASDGGKWDNFGTAVAIDAAGDTIVVGATFEHAVYVFERPGTGWPQLTTEQAKFMVDAGGDAVGLNAAGDTIVVGAPAAEGDKGATYVFMGSGTSWVQKSKLIASDGAAKDNFGHSVDIDTAGDTIVVGTTPDASASGAAYVFERPGTGWPQLATQQAKLTGLDSTASGDFGNSVAISGTGDIVVVGAPEADLQHTNEGAVHVFGRGGATWSPLAQLNASYGGVRDLVHIDGKPTWVFSESPIVSAPYDRFGGSVAITGNGDTVVAGATGVDLLNETQQYYGAAYVFGPQMTDRLQKFDSNGTLLATWPVGFRSQITAAQLYRGASGQEQIAWDIAVGSEGHIYISYYDGAVPGIRKYDANGRLVANFGWDVLERPSGLSVDAAGNVYVADWGANRIVVFDANGNFINSLDSTLYKPYGVAVGADGTIFVADTQTFRYTTGGRIQFFEPSQRRFIQLGDSINWPRDIVVDSSGDLYIGKPNDRILKYVHQVEYEPFEVADPDSDYDFDGLTNQEELAGWEVTFVNTTGSYTLHVTSNPLLKDTDYDGLSDDLEALAQTNPRDPDTDGDGKSDYVESSVPGGEAYFHLYHWTRSTTGGVDPKTNPNHFDTDLDGLEDGTELTFGSAPTLNDTEGDGINDFEEFNLFSNPASNDTDGDGLSDDQELSFNSSLLHPDQDRDGMFDSLEQSLGTDPWNNDTDADGIVDGTELFYGTKPLDEDSDDDNIPDGTEVDLRLNPLNQDTDGDGIQDGFELEQGTNPKSGDTDHDGISDLEDLDSAPLVVDHIILAYDPSLEGEQFVETLTRYTNVTVVSLEELVANYADAPYIVLVGRPGMENDTVGNQIREFLLDAGEVLQQMQKSDGYRLAVRHGVFTPTQTIVLLSQPYPSDHLRVLDLLSQQTVTVLPDWVRVEHHGNLRVTKDEPGGESVGFFTVEGIDSLKETDTTLLVALVDDEVRPPVEIRHDNASTIAFPLTPASGLENSEDEALNKYCTVTLSETGLNDTLENALTSAVIRMYYTGADLDRTGDGQGHIPGDIDEQSMVMYVLNETTGTWTKMDANLEGVHDTGVNAADVVLQGQRYDGYVWATVSHLSTFGLAGTRIVDLTPPELSSLTDPVLYEEGTTGHNISWVGGDRYPGSYELYRDLVRIDTGSKWQNGTLTWNVDGLPIGTYNFTLVVWDLANHSSSNMIELTVYNTPTGTNIAVMDPHLEVHITFSEVNGVGITSITHSAVEPDPPTLFKVVGSYYEITTTASYTGTITIGLPYNETQVTGAEQYLQLYHWDPETEDWTRVTTDVDSTNKLIYGETTTLSIFLVTEFIVPIPGTPWIWVLPPILLLGVLLAWRRRRKRRKDN